jgi:hypothetical protein
MSTAPADRLTHLLRAGRVLGIFHGGPLHGERKVIQACDELQVALFDPIPVDSPPVDHIHYRVGWYRGDTRFDGVAVMQRHYFYQGERSG